MSEVCRKTQQRFSYKSSPQIQNAAILKAPSQGMGLFDASSDVRLSDFFSRLLQNIKRDMKMFFLTFFFLM